MPKKYKYPKAVTAGMKRKFPRKMTKKKTQRRTKGSYLTLSRPGEVIPNRAYGIFRSLFKFVVTGGSASAQSNHVTIKMNSLVTPFSGVIKTNIVAVTGFASTSDSTGFSQYFGPTKMFTRSRVYHSTIRIKTMGGLLGTPYNVTVLPISVGATVGTYKQIANYPNSKEAKNFSTIYQPINLSHACSVAKIAGVDKKTVMQDDTYVGNAFNDDPNQLYAWVLAWQSADGAIPAGGLVMEVELDQYVRFEKPNIEQII